MIVWGGSEAATIFNTGGRYNPSTDSWTATSTTNAPAGRNSHTAVWTGSEMIVWGGTDDTPASSTPAADTIPARIVGQPPAPPTHPQPIGHTAVWTGSEMIVWGGYLPYRLKHRREIQSQHGQLDSHQHHQCAFWPMLHTAVWTGSEMIVWGGA